MRILYVLLVGLWLIFLPAISVAQTASDQTVTGPAAPIQRNNGGQITASAAVVLLLDYLKNAKWLGWLTQDTATRNRVAAVVGSLLAAIAVHATFDRTAGVLTITGLTATGIATGFVAWIKSYVFQQMMFKMSRSGA